jgi:hypothetical protein
VALGKIPEWLGKVPHSSQTITHVSPYRNKLGEPLLTIWQVDDSGDLRFAFGDGVQFLLDRSGSQIWADWPESMTLEDAAIYLLGPILGFVLRLRGLTTLHASAVCVGGIAIAFLGPPGAGKSTTAAALAKRGCPVLTDDIVALTDDDDLLIQPAHPQIYLWPNSVEVLYGTKDHLPPLTANWDKCHLDLTKPGYRFQEQPLPLGAVYFLGSRLPNGEAPFAERVPAHEGFMELVANSYGANRLSRDMRAKEFDLLGRLVTRVPLRRVTPHSDPARLPQLCDLIFEDSKQLVEA